MNPFAAYPPEPDPIQDGFEGPEKRLEVTFALSESLPFGLRSINKDEWQEMLNLVKCTIISSTSNKFLDSYVLSESSLFVYPSKIMLKTCGTTILLNCLDKLEEYAQRCGATMEFVIFSRKNFNFPHKQPFPHRTFETEFDLLKKKFDGCAQILGPVFGGGDHHFYYFADLRSLPLPEGAPASPFPTLEILMSELDVEAMSNFYRNENFVSSKATTKAVGLADILPNMTTDEHMFTPCGYSVNAISETDGSYFTVHVTPEPHCSFVSFETNAVCDIPQLIQEVIKLFRPGRFSVLTASPQLKKFDSNGLDGFMCKFKTQYDFEEGVSVYMFNYVKNSGSRRPIASLAA